jgi:dihydroflavonol-4-reductase
VAERVAITGSTGFLGMALAERLRAEGAQVTGLARSTSEPLALETLGHLGVLVITGDVARAETLPPLVQGADVVYHCAAVIGYRRRLEAAMRSANVLGTRNVIAACRQAGVKRLVHVSSIAAVGVADEPALLNEDSAWNAARLRAAYFDTKHESEQEVLAAAAQGLPAVVVNPAAIYGPSLVASNSGNIVTRIASGRLNVAPHGGMNVVPLSTVVDGALAAARRGEVGRRYILGGENLDYAEIIVRTGRAAGLRLRPRRLPTALVPALRAVMSAVEPLVPAGAWFTPHMCSVFGKWMWYDTTRMRGELGVEPADLDACLAATIAQLRKDGRLPAVRA